MGQCCAGEAVGSESKPQAQPQAEAQAASSGSGSYEERKAEEERIHEETDKIFQKYQKEIDEHAKLRGEYFEQSKAAFSAGEKGKAKELSDKGKEEGRLMEEARKAQAKACFEFRNPDDKLGQGIIDLHGLQLEFALEHMKDFVADAQKSKKWAEITIITGAGNHSDKAKGPKIKPETQKYLKEQGLRFEEINNGSVKVSL